MLDKIKWKPYLDSRRRKSPMKSRLKFGEKYIAAKIDGSDYEAFKKIAYEDRKVSVSALLRTIIEEFVKKEAGNEGQ